MRLHMKILLLCRILVIPFPKWTFSMMLLNVTEPSANNARVLFYKQQREYQLGAVRSCDFILKGSMYPSSIYLGLRR